MPRSVSSRARRRSSEIVAATSRGGLAHPTERYDIRNVTPIARRHIAVASEGETPGIACFKEAYVS